MNAWLPCEQAALLSCQEVESHLQVDAKVGLKSDEVSRRRNVHGHNAPGVKAPEPLWRKYLDQFNNPFILLLLASAIISLLMHQIDDAISITVAILIVVTVGFVQEYRSEKTLERMTALLPPTCQCQRDGIVDTVFAKYLVPGDIVHLTVGDRIPADVRLVSVNELTIDESSFTGETHPKHKFEELAERKLKLNVSDMDNIGFQGTLVVNGKGVGVVICTGEHSMFGEVFRMMQSEEPPRTPLQKSMDILGKQLSVYSLGIIGLIMLIGWWQGRKILDMFNVGVSLAVAAIPEGLPIVVTVTLAFGVMRMARRNAIVKRLPSVEALGCVDWICTDKTGTLTTNEQTVSNMLSAMDIFGQDVIGDVPSLLESQSKNVASELLEVGILCNNATTTSQGQINGVPMEKALLEVAKAQGMQDIRNRYPRLEEIPFNSERKFMAVRCSMNASDRKEYFVKGSPEDVLVKCSSAKVNGQLVVFSDNQRSKVLEIINYLSNREYKRVLVLARGTNMEQLEFSGLAAFHDPPRENVQRSISILKQSGVRVCMITGDSKDTAMAISGLIGLPEDGQTMISGCDMDKMRDADLEAVVEQCFCFYRTTPRHKVRIVKALQANGHIVAMTGDGVNDGVAIKKADVGISMGITGTDVCKEAADMILLDDDFSTILNAIEEGKCIFYNIRNFVRFQLSTSIAALMLISLSTLLDIPNPLNAMQILWINVIMDGPPAQSLGFEAVDHEVLKRPPRGKNEQILSRGLLINTLLSASIIIAGTLWVFSVTLDDGVLNPRERTMTFTCFVFFDMFNALSCRSQERLIFEIGFFSNKFFCAAVIFSVVGQLAVIYLPPLQYVFQTKSLDLKDLVLLTLLSSSVFVVCEGKKFLQRYYFSSSKLKKSVKKDYFSV